MATRIESPPMEHRSKCPIASTLDLVGDRWTLLVLRNIFRGSRRYGEHLESPEGIATNILADRLALLEREGLIEKVAYQTRPLRHEYRLTRKGADLLPVLQTLATWSMKHVPDRWAPSERFMHSRPEDFLAQD
ncbi:MAG: helix-turn-helix transcriptional regulator [Salaquimonas sp.]|jgi:DNA-binding HxlR family transcriptional regulator|nr:helix-turn-helix transcriptional regulator [Salaquimonas sp.]